MNADSRFARGKHDRNALWIMQHGRCALCSQPMNPANWHADHVVPWSKGGKTTPDNLQALCAECNLRKGGMMLRRHQDELRAVLSDIARGRESSRRIICDVVPGGGKGSVPLIVASELIPSVVDKVAVIVPRCNLQSQAARTFISSDDAHIRGYLRTPAGFEIRESTNEIDPSRGTIGFVTTYQALAVDKSDSILRELRRFRYALVLDEGHHVCTGRECDDDRKLWTSVGPLVEAAHVCVITSGTLERGDKLPIPLLPYKQVGDSKFIVDKEAPGYVWVTYGITDALAERAIIPLHFEHLDGAATYMDADGDKVEVGKLGDDRRALWTALETAYATHLLDKCADDWVAMKRNNSRSAMLVVCRDQQQARRTLTHLRNRGVACKIATSDDSPAAQSALKEFREGGTDCLVSVQMAYEGMDVPRITHIACLTHIRSRPWIMQMFARAWRFDRHAGPWEHQRAVAYVPDDDQMREVIADLNASFAEAMIPEGTKVDPPPPPPQTQIVPLTSIATTARASDGVVGDEVSADEHPMIRDALRAAGLEDRMTTIEGARFVRSFLSASPQVGERPMMPEPETAKERERKIRTAIELHLRRVERAQGLPFGELNKQLIRTFRKSREQMNEGELREVLAHSHQRWPLRQESVQAGHRL